MFRIFLAALAVAIVVVALFLLPSRPHAQVTSVTLVWTASGDDGVVGRGSSYEMRYRSVPVSGTDTLSWWNAGTVVPMAGKIPTISGTLDSVTVTGTFNSGQSYYFILKQCDEVPNCSFYSNVAIKLIPDVIPPSRILDLLAR